MLHEIVKDFAQLTLLVQKNKYPLKIANQGLGYNPVLSSIEPQVANKPKHSHPFPLSLTETDNKPSLLLYRSFQHIKTSSVNLAWSRCTLECSCLLWVQQLNQFTRSMM